MRKTGANGQAPAGAAKLISIVRERFPPGRRYSNARHPFSEVVYVLQGEGQYLTEGSGARPLREGALVALRPRVRHTIVAGAAGLTVYSLFVAWAGGGLRAPCRAVAVDERILLEVALSRLLERSVPRAPGVDGVFRAVLALLDMELARPPARSPAGRARRDTHAAAASREAIRIIHEEYRSPLTVGGLAARAGLSESRLAHVFRESAGVSVVKYIIECRLNAARHLLTADPEMPIKAVAVDAGFQSANHFYVQFNKRFGMSPLAYRQTLAGVGSAD